MAYRSDDQPTQSLRLEVASVSGVQYPQHHIKAMPDEISRYCFVPGGITSEDGRLQSALKTWFRSVPTAPYSFTQEPTGGSENDGLFHWHGRPAGRNSH